MLQFSVRNRLLKALTPEDFDRLEPHLVPAETSKGQVIAQPHVPITRLLFPEVGFISVTAPYFSGMVDVGLIGPEGLVGATPVLLGSNLTPSAHYVRAPGGVLSIGVDEMRKSFDESASLRRILLRYIESVMIQTAQAAFVNATCSIEVRLARWLLMCQDRLGRDEFPVTHESLSTILAVQRTSVTLAIQVLEGNGLVKARRGRIEVRDRERLRDLADESYGVPEAEYVRLIGEERSQRHGIAPARPGMRDAASARRCAAVIGEPGP